MGALLGPLILVLVAFFMEGCVMGFVSMFPLADRVCLGKLRRGEWGGEEGIDLIAGRMRID